MIRIGLPTPLFFKLRLRAQIASNHLIHQSNEIRRNLKERFHHDSKAVGNTPSSFIHYFPAEPKNEQKQILAELISNHQNLVDLLCNAAKTGLRTEDFANYTQLREWFVEHYSAHCRPFLNQHLLKSGLAPKLEGESDPFAVLFMHTTILEAIHSFEVLGAIVRSRDILEKVNSDHNINCQQ